MFIKVCGMRDPENIAGLARLPVDLIGFIFYPGSPRAAGEGLEAWLAEEGQCLAGKKRVGVFVNGEMEEVLNKVHDFELDYVQLHGNESPGYCQLLRSISEGTSMRGFQLIKAFAVDEAFDFAATTAFAPYCAYFLFDTRSAAYGGSGRQFDWGLLERYRGETPFLLSGGIGPDSAAALRSLRHPRLAGLDVNSRFESAPGQKDLGLVRRFLEEWRPADREKN
jgi:phosphoribosylanthranilate isomerase